MDKAELILKEFVDNSIFRLDESTRMISIAFKKIDEQEIWQKPNKSSNSIGNLILHLSGNLTQYIISSLGETDDIRNREVEFNTDGGYSKKELVTMLIKTVSLAKETIKTASNTQWIHKREVQGFIFSGIGVVLHAVEHYSYHTGQIAFYVKQLKNKDLGFYDDLDLNIKNND